MFSTKPAQRPAGPRRWFRKEPHPSGPCFQTQTTAVPVCPPPYASPGSPGYFPTPAPLITVVHRPARSPEPMPSPQPMSNLSTPISDQPFNGWMAKFCIEPSTDTNACCLSFWAPYAQYGKTHWRLKQVEDGRDPTNASWSSGYGCNGPCWAWFGMCCLLQCDCILTGFQRTRIRATYGIDGSIVNDFCLSMFCRPCTMVQMDREVRAREGDMDLRTNPMAPVITNQPSRIQEMRYTSPRATASDNLQDRPPNSQRDCEGGACDGSSPPTAGLTPKKLQMQQPKSAKQRTVDLKSDKPKSENHDKATKAKYSHVGMSQLKSQSSSPLKATDSKAIGYGSHPSSREDQSQKANKEVPAGKKPWGQKSDRTPKGSQDENKKKSGAYPGLSSTHGLTYRPPVPETSSNEKHSKQYLRQSADSISRAGSISGIKGKEKETQPKPHALTKVTNEERRTSESTITDCGSAVVGSPKAKTWKKVTASTNDTHELSYVHDFTDCPVDKNVLDYYENEERRSQASQQHALADCSRTYPTSAHNSNSPKQHTIQDCPQKDISKSSNSANAQPHALADCREKDNTGKEKSHEVQTHTLAENAKSKPAGAQSHALVDCPEEDNARKVNSAYSQPHTLAGCAQEPIAKAKAALPLPHVLVDCETTSDNESSGLQPHALVDCDRTEDISDIQSSGPLPHTLGDCDHESVSNSPTKQHALVDCRGDGMRKIRRASSNPGSSTDRHSQPKPHRLVSCPESSLDQKEEKEKLGHHVPENARINQSGDSQATMKPSSKHTLSDSIGGAQLERQTAPEARPGRPSSLISLRDFIKGNQDTADHPRKSRYRKEVENAANASGGKRPSQAQHALSQILGGNGSRKGSSREDHVEAIKGAMQSVGDKIKKRADSIGDSVSKQTDKIRGDTSKGTDGVGEKVKKRAESVGDEATKQTGKVAGKDEHKSSGGFANMLSKMSPRSRA